MQSNGGLGYGIGPGQATTSASGSDGIVTAEQAPLAGNGERTVAAGGEPIASGARRSGRSSQQALVERSTPEGAVEGVVVVVAAVAVAGESGTEDDGGSPSVLTLWHRLG